MSAGIFRIAMAVVAFLAGSYLLLKFNPELQLKPWIGPIYEIYGLVEEPVFSESHNAVFCIFDPSGSGKSTYSVPIINVDFIKQIIAAIADRGYGEIWLTFVDRSALNNRVLHFTIPEKKGAFEPPIRKVGQLKGEYDRELAKFKVDSAKNALQIAADLKNYNEIRDEFLMECSDMIAKAYAPKKPYEDYSDVIGSLNAAVRSLETVDSDSIHFQSILLVSDGVQDLPAGDTRQQLNEIPEDVMLVMVNHGGSLNSVVAGKSTEVDNLDRGLEKVIRVYKPKIQ